MAGVKGKSGGYRAGAGRKPKGTPRTRGSSWMKTRARILERDGYLCQCERCKSSASPLPAHEVDHIIPLCDGGVDGDSNLQAMNVNCHKKKSADEASSRNAAHNAPVPQGDKSMLQFLEDVALGRTEASSLQVRAAIAAVQYTHAKKGEGGKKDDAQNKAKDAAASGFKPRVVR